MLGGEFEETQRSFESLLQAFALAVLIIYLILAAQFKSYLQPVLVLSAVLFSITGVVFGTLVSQTLFTVNSFVAVVGVTGVVVNDSLVLVEFINRGYRAGMSRLDAIRHGLDTRLRPIVLTTLTTTLGLLPMALGIPQLLGCLGLDGVDLRNRACRRNHPDSVRGSGRVGHHRGDR